VTEKIAAILISMTSRANGENEAISTRLPAIPSLQNYIISIAARAAETDAATALGGRFHNTQDAYSPLHLIVSPPFILSTFYLVLSATVFAAIERT
jgi:hypothetical protein